MTILCTSTGPEGTVVWEISRIMGAMMHVITPSGTNPTEVNHQVRGWFIGSGTLVPEPADPGPAHACGYLYGSAMNRAVDVTPDVFATGKCLFFRMETSESPCTFYINTVGEMARFDMERNRWVPTERVPLQET